MTRQRSVLVIDLPTLLLLSLFLLLLIIQLSSTPPLWWDEGWTLSVARNWVERGHYGHLRVGQLAPLGLEAAFLVTAPIALSFRLFGIGIWQARLVGLIFTLATLSLVYYLAGRLYDRPVAIGTLAVLLFMSSRLQTHPVLMGRQVLAEMPMLFYLLAGYACFLSAWHRPRWFMPLTVLFWGLGVSTKVQPLPFWTASLMVPLLVALYRRSWKAVSLLGVGLIGSLMVSRLLKWLPHLVLHQMLPKSPVQGLYDVTALVTVPDIRLAVLIVSLVVGLPTLLGLFYATWKLLAYRSKVDLGASLEVVRLALLTLAGSWFAWYVLLSVGWIRYLFPATFIGSIFVAPLLRDLTDDFNLSSTIKRTALIFRRLNRQNAGALLALLLIVCSVPVTLKMLHQSYVVQADTSVLQLADFLNTRTAPDALIETCDSELFFLLDRPYHYPPNQIHVELNRRTWLGQDVPINYDPLAADPEYLVVGPFSRMWDLYGQVLTGDHFTLVQVIGRYAVYQRQRK